MRTFVSGLRFASGLAFAGAVVAVTLCGLLLLLPFGRKARILFTNHVGTVLGQGIIGIAGSRVTVHGRAHAQGHAPAIFANNHTSNLDAFTTIWLTPQGTVGLAKKQIIYYPFYGLAWILSGHPTIDRSNPKRAHASMEALGAFVNRHRLSVCMLPEGTRARDGRLQPFKKGIVHLALQTKLPIVPMVTVGAAGAWNRGQWALRPRDIHVHFLPPVDTSDWQLERIDEHLAEVRRRFVEALPDSMLRPEDRAELPEAA